MNIMKKGFLKTGILALLIAFASCSEDNDDMMVNSDEKSKQISI